MNNIIENSFYFILGAVVVALINIFLNRKFKVFDESRKVFLDERHKITTTKNGQDFIRQGRAISDAERFIVWRKTRLQVNFGVRLK